MSEKGGPWASAERYPDDPAPQAVSWWKYTQPAVAEWEMTTPYERSTLNFIRTLGWKVDYSDTPFCCKAWIIERAKWLQQEEVIEGAIGRHAPSFILRDTCLPRPPHAVLHDWALNHFYALNNAHIQITFASRYRRLEWICKYWVPCHKKQQWNNTPEH